MPPATPDHPDLFARGAAAPLDLAPSAGEWQTVADALPDLLRMGTSSWSFPGWTGSVWDRELPPGRLSRIGLEAYARHPLLRAVAIDRGYYEPLDAATLRRYADQVPDDFRFLLKADRRLLFPDGPGADPDLYLNPAWAAEEVVGPALDGLGRKLQSLLFQFAPVPATRLGGPRRFAEELYRFLDRLPREIRGRMHVEVRTPALLTPDLGQALHHAGAGLGRVVHPEMPEVAGQASRTSSPSDEHGALLVRWMLQRGHRYAEAKEAWAPFREMQAPDPDARGAVADAVRAAVAAGRAALVIVNNKAEGSAPASIEALAQRLVNPPFEGASEDASETK